jgi:hypothetical protein
VVGWPHRWSPFCAGALSALEPILRGRPFRAGALSALELFRAGALSARSSFRARALSALEPILRRLPGLADGVATALGGDTGDRVGAQGDILKVLRSAITIVKVSVVHPPSANTLSAAAATVGAAAARRDHPRGQYTAGWSPMGTRLYRSPLSVMAALECLPRSCCTTKAMRQHLLEPISLVLASFVEGALRETSVGLCRGNCGMNQASARFLARVTGRWFCAGIVCPSDVVV